MSSNDYPCPICPRVFYSIGEAQLHALDTHIIRGALHKVADWCPLDPNGGLHDFAGRARCECGARNYAEATA